MIFKTALRFLLAALLCAGAVNSLAAKIDPKIDACIRKNAPRHSVIEDIRLQSEVYSQLDETFDKETLTARVFWKHAPEGNSSLLAVFNEPEDITGVRLLFLEKKPGNEIYVYMPALGKVQRISSDRIAASMYGMDFSYEDFQWLYNMQATAMTDQLPDVVIDGQAMHVFAMKPSSAEGSLYETIYAYFDKASCVIRKVEFYEPGNKLRKALLVEPDEIKAIDGKLVPQKFLMRDIQKNSDTELTITGVELDTSIPEPVFDPAQLKHNSGTD